jgi:hypothetical protein
MARAKAPEAERQRKVLAGLELFDASPPPMIQLSRSGARNDRRPETGRGQAPRAIRPPSPPPSASFNACAACVRSGLDRSRVSCRRAIPAAPKKSALAWVADVLVWGGVAAVLLYSIDAVDLGNISRLFAGNDSTQLFVHDLLRPDFSDWKTSSSPRCGRRCRSPYGAPSWP